MRDLQVEPLVVINTQGTAAPLPQRLDSATYPSLHTVDYGVKIQVMTLCDVQLGLGPSPRSNYLDIASRSQREPDLNAAPQDRLPQPKVRKAEVRTRLWRAHPSTVGSVMHCTPHGCIPQFHTVRAASSAGTVLCTILACDVHVSID